MTFGEYQDGVVSTWRRDQPGKDQILNGVLGLCGEAGEYADAIKKMLFHGVPVSHEALVKELGDVLYYVTICAWIQGVNLESIAIQNNKKLAARYPEGFKLGGGIREGSNESQPARDRLPQTPGEPTTERL